MEIEELASNRCSDCGLCSDRPSIPMYAPFSVRDLAPSSTHLWCSCGRSKTEPICDRVGCLHSSFRPVSFEAKSQRIHLLCGCKYTRSPPFCDGMHSVMPYEPSHPPCKCALSLKLGSMEDEDFYIEGVKEMFAQNNEPFNTEPIDRQFFRRNIDGFLVCGPGHKGYLLFELGEVTPFMPKGPKWWGRYVFLSDMYVRRTERGKGIAGLMIQKAIEIALNRDSTIQEAFAAVYFGNESSLKVFQKLGFEKFATVGEKPVCSKNVQLNLRPFDKAKDSEIVDAGLLETAERPNEVEPEEEREIFVERFESLTQMVLDEKGETVAWFVFEITNETPYGVNYGEYIHTFGFLHYIFVRPGHRRKGIGSKIVAFAEDVCAKNGLEHLKTSYNVQASNFHNVVGFKDAVWIVRKPIIIK